MWYTLSDHSHDEKIPHYHTCRSSSTGIRDNRHEATTASVAILLLLLIDNALTSQLITVDVELRQGGERAQFLRDRA